jgi:CheY-like chemotaxis protein
MAAANATAAVAAPTKTSAPNAARRTHSVQFLVIDDDPVHRIVIGKVGEKAGYGVTGAGSIEEAISQIQRQKFDCISLDLSLGGKNGALVLHDIAEHNAGALVFIISSATTQVREETLAVAKSFNLDVLEVPKPVDLSALRVRLAMQAAAVLA